MGRVDAVAREVGQGLLAVAVVADRVDHRDVGAHEARHHGLVGTLAAEALGEPLADDVSPRSGTRVAYATRSIIVLPTTVSQGPFRSIIVGWDPPPPARVGDARPADRARSRRSSPTHAPGTRGSEGRGPRTTERPPCRAGTDARSGSTARRQDRVIAMSTWPPFGTVVTAATCSGVSVPMRAFSSPGNDSSVSSGQGQASASVSSSAGRGVSSAA